MNLLTHVTLSLEREVTFERVHAFKSVAIIAVGTLVGAITAASTLNHDQASDLIIGVIAMTAPLWQAGHIGIDFEPALARLITALIDGMTHGPSAG
jgi:Tetracyclin repressor-like, C-terminal domain